MGLYRRNNRFWWISYSVAGRQVFESSHSLNKRAAQKLLAIRQAEIAEGRFRLVKSNPPRLEEWAAEFLDSIQHQNTRRRYTSSIGNLLAFFKAARLSQITPDRIEAFKKARLKSGVKSSTANRDLAVLKPMLKQAARQRLIAQSPFEEVEFLEERKHRRQPHILTFEEQERLLAVAPPRVRVLIVLLTETGLRVNKEALSLKWADVDLANGAIHVRESKTPAGRRTVPLSELCKAELIRWRSLTGPEFSEHLFPNLENTRHPLQGGRRSWTTTLRRAGLHYFPIYSLRATFASRLSAAGVPDVFVSQLMGHAGGLLHTYAKAIDEYRQEAIRKLESYRESAGKQNAEISPASEVIQ